MSLSVQAMVNEESAKSQGTDRVDVVDHGSSVISLLQEDLVIGVTM